MNFKFNIGDYVKVYRNIYGDVGIGTEFIVTGRRKEEDDTNEYFGNGWWSEENLELVKPNNRGKNKRGKNGRFIKEVTKETKIANILSWYLPEDTAKTACKQIMEVI